MKTSSILTSVLLEPWMILPEAAEAYLPIIAAWLLGNEVRFEEKGDLDFLMSYAGYISPGSMEDIAEFPTDSIAIVSLKGELIKNDGMCRYGAMSISHLIKQLAVSKNIGGLVLDVDGPGGAVSAAPPLIQAIEFFKSKNKPVGVHADLIASAHYCVGCHANFINLNNSFSSRAGSIGTMMQLPDFRKQLEQRGITIQTIYASQSTHKNREFENALEGDHELIKQNTLDPLAAKFQQIVREQRGSKLNESVDGLLNGSMFFGEAAVANGLVDGIATLEATIQQVSDLIEIQKFMKY